MLPRVCSLHPVLFAGSSAGEYRRKFKRPFPPAPPGARPAPPLFPPSPWGAPRPGAPWAPVPPGAIPRRIRAPAAGQLGRPPAGHRTAGAADGRGQTGRALSDGQRTTTCRPRPAARDCFKRSGTRLPWHADVVCVDMIGIGAGVHDRLAELRRQGRRRGQVVGVTVSNSAPPKQPHDEMQAHLLRDHLWLLVARWLRDAEPVFCAPDRQACADLAAELVSVRYAFTSDGALVVEAKDAMKKRLGHSPDLADALGCTFALAAPLLRRAGVWGP